MQHFGQNRPQLLPTQVFLNEVFHDLKSDVLRILLGKTSPEIFRKMR